MRMVVDEWVRAAMADDSMVVDLLVKLKNSQQPSSRDEDEDDEDDEVEVVEVKKVAEVKFKPRLLRVSWGMKFPRSRPGANDSSSSSPPVVPRGGGDAVTNTSAAEEVVVLVRKDNGEGSATRCSPTTPLSWSGGCDGGGGAAAAAASSSFTTTTADEESSLHNDAISVRSKGAVSTETDSGGSKRSWKKKGFSELTEEEDLELERKANLKRELAAMHASIEEERIKNENLKRLKFDLNAQNGGDSSLAFNEPRRETYGQFKEGQAASWHYTAASTVRRAETNYTPAESGGTQQAAALKEQKFLLPDLNMEPPEGMR